MDGIDIRGLFRHDRLVRGAPVGIISIANEGPPELQRSRSMQLNMIGLWNEDTVRGCSRQERGRKGKARGHTRDLDLFTISPGHLHSDLHKIGSLYIWNCHSCKKKWVQSDQDSGALMICKGFANYWRASENASGRSIFGLSFHIFGILLILLNIPSTISYSRPFFDSDFPRH